MSVLGSLKIFLFFNFSNKPAVQNFGEFLYNDFYVTMTTDNKKQ